MSFATAIRADHLSKNYKLRRERTRTLKETVLRQYAPAEQVQARHNAKALGFIPVHRFWYGWKM